MRPGQMRPGQTWNYSRNEPYPPRFRPPHGIARKAVRGGRWNVRRTKNRGRYQWHAWTTGKARIFNRYFSDYESAIEWAQAVAHGIASGDERIVAELYYRKTKKGYPTKRDRIVDKWFGYGIIRGE